MSNKLIDNEKKYHHGDLRHALIEAGIGLVNEVGESQLSLRKVAKLCDVSQAAPYAHFKSKEDLLNEMKTYVVNNFMNVLIESVNSVESELFDQSDNSTKFSESNNTKNAKVSTMSIYEKKIVAMGRSYVTYFLHHPTHYNFLFSNDFIKIELSLSNDSHGNYEPFELLKSLYLEMNKTKGRTLTTLEQELELINIWSTVQGLSSIVCMKKVTWDKDWESVIENLII